VFTFLDGSQLLFWRALIGLGFSGEIGGSGRARRRSPFAHRAKSAGPRGVMATLLFLRFWESPAPAVLVFLVGRCVEEPPDVPSGIPWC
jgi:hypothetical protein